MKRTVHLILALCALPQVLACAAEVSQWEVFEASYESTKTYAKPFTDVEVNVVFRSGDKQWIVPAFWAGAGKWIVRFAPPLQGDYTFRVTCSDPSNKGLNRDEQSLRVTAYTGDNPLLTHGFLRVSANKRHFEHADGTPFFWLGDTWWKCLCKRMTWEGFQELTADRKAKGFSVVQIVCGVYPDEGVFEPRWENEGGKPYPTRDFTVVNPKYFAHADRRIQCLVNAGIVPAIVGGWGRGDCDGMVMAGVAGIKRHWRNLIARYGAYPTIWIVGGESGGPEWTEVARYVQQIDPYHHPSTMHPFDSGRSRVTDETVIDFDMLQTGHGGWPAARTVIPKLKAAYDREPAMPVMVGEHSYEQHMQTGFADVQRYVFWSTMLSGSAGLTYGAAGVWHASVEGDPGLANVYDRTTWKEGMQFAGSTQLGYGKRLLERYPWAQFEVHPEWTDPDSFAAGIPGQVRFIYTPNRGVYNWKGLQVKGLEADIPYRAFYFDPVRGTYDDLGTILRGRPEPFAGHTEPLLFEDHFDDADASRWTDHGSATRRQNGHLIGGKGMVTTFKDFNEPNGMVSVDALSDAEAGIILRFHGPDNYVVALYSPSLKCIFLHDRHYGQWGSQLGRVDIPKIGRHIRLTAAVAGTSAMLVVSDSESEYRTPIVEVENTTPGQVGVWLFQIGERQDYDDFAVSRTLFIEPDSPRPQKRIVVHGSDFETPPLPSPQDWVLVLERTEDAESQASK